MITIVEIHGKQIIGELEQLESEPSIVLHDCYELITNIYKDTEFIKYPPYAEENICVFNSVHVTTIYQPSSAILDKYALAKPQLLLN